ncbi:hypothetical protein QN379_20165 [Glaciimonas sp. Gout2]|uniref:hypothetical protein n=1 Tax=unclassified Glaciimonas TaxID=2644401 RepID=UPI002B237A47|nr:MULTISPECIES: hypothetical protein [unclassified Glaciimonas]MEB0010167.1 hypothetical protein [Glaciimonas sp. Cout2]MEB0084328.1 hypothetical protein [Glaciimonas sp. Gout2]
MPTHAQASTVKNIHIVDNLTLLHCRTSAILATLSMAFDSQQDGLPKTTVQEVLEVAQDIFKKAQEEVTALQVRITPLG